MAKLYVTSPNGTAENINIPTMNITDSGTTVNNWTKLPNGLLIITTHFNVTSSDIDSEGVFTWSLPLRHWNSRTIMSSCLTTSRVNMMVINTWDVATDKVYFVSYVNGSRNLSQSFAFSGLMFDWITRTPGQ